MFPLEGLFVYVLVWGSMIDLKVKGFDRMELKAACEEKEAKRSGAILYRLHRSDGGNYAILCNTPRCAERPGIVSLERVRCKKHPERRTEVVEPESYTVETEVEE